MSRGWEDRNKDAFDTRQFGTCEKRLLFETQRSTTDHPDLRRVIDGSFGNPRAEAEVAMILAAA